MANTDFQRWRIQAEAVMDALLTLSESGAPPEKLEPLKKALTILFNDLEESKAVNGKKPMRVSRRVALAAFAAAVTVLKRDRGVAAAIADVAVPHGVDQKDIKNFRDRLNRGRADPMSDHIYKFWLADFESMPRAEIMAQLDHLARGCFCT
jgi:hypothetical protein